MATALRSVTVINVVLSLEIPAAFLTLTFSISGIEDAAIIIPARQKDDESADTIESIALISKAWTGKEQPVTLTVGGSIALDLTAPEILSDSAGAYVNAKNTTPPTIAKQAAALAYRNAARFNTNGIFARFSAICI